MTFREMLTEFYARGFDYLNDSGVGETRAKRWINQSYQEICGLDDWPFLEVSTSGSLPLTIADLRTIMSATNTVTELPLSFIDRRTVVDTYPDLTEPGNPEFAYFTSPTTIEGFPVGSDTINVRYVKVPTDLSADSDEPVIPARYRYAIVDFACGRAYMDSDNPQMAQAVRGDAEATVQLMREHLMLPQHQDADQVVVYGYGLDFD